MVCLQELKAPDERFPEKAVSDLGYHAIWHGQKNWNGVAILSRVALGRARALAHKDDARHLDIPAVTDVARSAHFTMRISSNWSRRNWSGCVSSGHLPPEP
ncbi:endonuclease/exonuclease/phosphatase family protein [Sphingomonas koreensis]|uniref:endonuclease/exonuclease/phosphatase family protein n=1 Tax=Sphingomonas koreensis TaxID=93064 RepID=UPI0026AB616D